MPRREGASLCWALPQVAPKATAARWWPLASANERRAGRHCPTHAKLALPFEDLCRKYETSLQSPGMSSVTPTVPLVPLAQENPGAAIAQRPGRILVEMRGVYKQYPGSALGQYALYNIDLAIAEGEVIAIVGRSGSGKSTLLNILATLDEGTAGTYRFDGQLVSALWRSSAIGWRVSLRNLRRRVRKEFLNARIRRRMGFVFQTPFMLSNFTVQQNVSLPWWIGHGVPPPAHCVSSMLSSLGLQTEARKTAELISGGQRQRVAIGRALLNEPRIVFADEPTGSLDIATADEVMTHLRAVCAKNGAALVLVTHQPETALKFAERILVIADGQIAADDKHFKPDQLEALLRKPSRFKPPLYR